MVVLLFPPAADGEFHCIQQFSAEGSRGVIAALGVCRGPHFTFLIHFERAESKPEVKLVKCG